MKKLAIFVSLLFIFIAAVGITAPAASFGVTSTTLPSGEAYQPYTAQITMKGGNDGYTFSFRSGILPTGLTLASDGTLSGTPTSSGTFSYINVWITNTDGTSADVVFSLYIAPRPITVTVDAPDNAVYDGVTAYTAEVRCFDEDGKPLSDLSPTVRYGTDRLISAVDAGSYHIKISAPRGCVISQRSGDSYLFVAGATVKTLAVESFSQEYDGNYHGITADHVTLDPENAGWAVEYLHPGAESYTSEEPKEPGIYTARVYTTNPNYDLRTATATITITKAVNFTVSDYEYSYEAGVKRKAQLTHDGPETLDYTVSYVGTDGNEYAEPEKAGVYTIKITINTPGCAVGTIFPVNTLTISGTPVNFTVTNTTHPYSGTEKEAAVTAEPAVPFTVIYRDADGNVVEPKDAGTYSISISLTDGGYMLGTIDNTTLTISPLPITFTGSSLEVDYNGQEHTLSLEPSDTLAKGNYTLTYSPRGGVTTLDAAKNAGLYDVGVRFTNGNFTLGEAISATLTVKAVLKLNQGNSPAAMIYKDSAHASDAVWQAAALKDLKEDNQFSADYLPAGCSESVIYAPVQGLMPDLDVNTLVVKDINSFTDPGMTVQDGVTTAPLTGTLEPTATVGLYTLTYTYAAAYGTETRQRDVIVVPNKIGDVNADGNLNGIDANHLDIADAATANFIQGRIWDVNMDGLVGSADAAAIRNRFKTKLSPYYPWIES